jgi:hypothetical protein
LRDLRPLLASVSQTPEAPCTYECAQHTINRRPDTLDRYWGDNLGYGFQFSCASARRYTVILRGIEATKQECTSPIGETRMLDLGSAALLMVERELWHRLIYFNLRAHFLDLRGLLFKLGREGLNFPLLLRNRSLELVLQPFHFAVFFEEFIEQHRIHLVVADGIRLSVDR